MLLTFLGSIFKGPTSIALGVFICGLLLTSYHMANGGELRTSTIDSNGVAHKKLSILKKAGAEGWITGLAVGATTGVIAYITTTKINNVNMIWLAWIFFVLIVAVYVWLALVWYRIGERMGQGVCFTLVAVLMALVAKTLVGIISAPWGNTPFSRIFCMLPWFLVVGLITFMVLDVLDFRAGEGDEDCQKIKIAVKVAALVLVVVLIVLGLAGCGGPDATAVEKAYEQNATSDLTVTKLTAEDLEKLTLTKYKDVPETLLDSSLSPHDKERTSKTGMSDALTYGFKSKNTAEMFKELEAEILRNPVYGVTVANAIKDKKIGDQKIGDFNHWLVEMVEKNKTGVFVWCEYRNNDTKVIYVTEEYRCYAATLCTFLERLVSQGVQSHQTIENWCLNCSAANKDRAGVKADYQYKKDALVLSYIGKNEAGKKDAKGLFTIGFNVHDKRPEFFGKEDPPKVVNDNPPKETTPGKPSNPDNPPTPTNPDNPPSPTTPPGPGPDPTEPTKYNKNPDDMQVDGDKDNPNDDKGNGGDTNNGDGARTSKEDPTNGSMQENHEQYREDMNTYQTQKTDSDDNTPSTKTDSGTNVDNNGDNGYGYGGANDQTPAPDVAKTHDGQSVDNESGNNHLGSVPD